MPRPRRQDAGDNDAGARTTHAEPWVSRGMRIPRDLGKVLNAEIEDQGSGSAQAIAAVAIGVFLGAPDPVRRELVEFVRRQKDSTLNSNVTPESLWRAFLAALQVYDGASEHEHDTEADLGVEALIARLRAQADAAPKKQGDPPDAKMKPSGGRPSGRRAS